MYKEPKTPDATLVDHLDKMLSAYCSQYTNVVLCGDINVNMLKNNNISDIVDVHGMKSIVTKPTCFKSETPTLIDVVFTTVLKRFKHVCCIESDLSDFHQMVCFSTKFNAPCHINKVITYRSYKNFNREQFLCDLASAPFHAAQVFDTVDDAYWFSESLLLDVVNKHAPLKKRVIKQRQIPYMNSTLRKQNNVRDRFKRIWLKNKSMKNREAYVRHRNLSTKLRKQSLNKYLKDKCTINNTHNNKEFWKITKPFMSHKGSSANTDISLIENDAIINDQTGVATVINDYYVNVTKSIGQPDLLDVNEDIEDVFLAHESHESVQYIEQYMKDQKGSNNTFTFSHVTMNDVLKELRSINIRKTTGCDLIPGKLIKEGADFLCKPIQSLINKCIDTCTFPNALKLADVVPIFKKNDMLNKMNYRPISILSCISKIFEKLLISQLRHGQLLR